jgi:hypothetical protein
MKAFEGVLGPGAAMSQVQKLAAMTAQNHKIDIVFGDKCATDGKTVYLCDLPDSSKPSDIRMLIHVMYHEISHVLNTDFKKLKRWIEGYPEGLKKIAHTCYNVLEDIRIEKLMSDKYPGVRIRMRDFVAEFLKDKKQREISNTQSPLKTLLDVVYLRGREMQVIEEGLEGFNLQVPDEIETLYLKYCKDITERASKELDSDKMFDLADELFNRLKELIKDSENPPEEQQESQESGDSSQESGLQVGDVVRLKGSDRYGKVIEVKDGSLEVEEMSKEEARKCLLGS